VILLDTHIWIWWVQDDARLTAAQKQQLTEHEATGLSVAAISCWEVAKAVELGKLVLPVDVGDWLRIALQYPGVNLIRLTPEIAVESTRLPAPFHRDPADQIIVATARLLDAALMTSDAKINAYPHVKHTE
jgi:PIN domain nuclease of toxin-antitoxin system